MSYNRFWMLWIILKLIFLSPQRVLMKNERALFNTENERICLIFDSTCTGWQSTHQKMLNIDLSKLVG